MPPSPSRTRAERRGRRGEALAALFLRCQLYAIRARRVKTPVGEIDLVAARGRTIVFVEVKVRRNRAEEANALASVNTRRIARAAQFYVARNPQLAGRDMRFDVIFLAPMAWPRHVRNAFDLPE